MKWLSCNRKKNSFTSNLKFNRIFRFLRTATFQIGDMVDVNFCDSFFITAPTISTEPTSPTLSSIHIHCYCYCAAQYSKIWWSTLRIKTLLVFQAGCNFQNPYMRWFSNFCLIPLFLLLFQRTTEKKLTWMRDFGICRIYFNHMQTKYSGWLNVHSQEHILCVYKSIWTEQHNRLTVWVWNRKKLNRIKWLQIRHKLFFFGRRGSEIISKYKQ